MQLSLTEILEFVRHEALLGNGPIELFETHAAVVLVGPTHALKIKREVRYDYLDFSTLESRRAACEREISINKPHAPEIYDRLVAITREPDGRLAFDGSGAVSEWAVLMRRFEQSDVLSNRIIATPLAPADLRQLADAVARYHSTAPVITDIDGSASIGALIEELIAAFERHPTFFPQAQVKDWTRDAWAQHSASRDLLQKRANQGYIRRCHGDLHLGNIVLWRGLPTLFDAIEFDEKLAVIDILYDLAFLLMDLDERDQRAAANAILNRYLWRRDDPADLDGLACLPLFLALRAGIRAMVGAQKAALKGGSPPRQAIDAITHYFEHSLAYLRPAPARLIAVGGLSGSGKSTLAAKLSPLLGAPPGAVHLRSDLERKAMFNVEETQVLTPETYTPQISKDVYGRLAVKAERALRAGHAVTVDAVYALPEEKHEIATVATRCATPFTGLWLAAPAASLKLRVEQRQGDASDATADVVERQLTYDARPDGWIEVDASGAPNETLRRACALIGLVPSEK